MIIRGTEKNNELKDLCTCCDGHGNQPGIQLVGDDLVATDPISACGDNLVCLKDLWIPVDGSFKTKKILNSGEQFTLNQNCNSFKFLSVYVNENKTIYYRFEDKPYNAFLNLKIGTNIINWQTDTADISLAWQIDTNVSIPEYDENNVDPFWSDIIQYVDSTECVSNCQFGSYLFTGIETYQIYRQGTSFYFSDVVILLISIGNLVLEVKVQIDIDSSNQSANTEILSIEHLTNTESVIILQSVDQSTEVDGFGTILTESNSIVKLMGIIEWKTLVALLVLSSSENLGNIQFKNQYPNNVEMCILGGN